MGQRGQSRGEAASFLEHNHKQQQQQQHTPSAPKKKEKKKTVAHAPQQKKMIWYLYLFSYFLFFSKVRFPALIVGLRATMMMMIIRKMVEKNK